MAGGRDDGLWAGALLGLGEAATLAGDYHQAAESYLAAAEAASRAGGTTIGVRAWRGLGLVRWRQEKLPKSVAAFEPALQVVGTSDHVEAAETLLNLADLHSTNLGRHAEGLAMAERALAMAERLGDPCLETVACRVVGNLRCRTSQLADASHFLGRALTLAAQQDAPDLAAETCGYLANLHCVCGDVQQSWEVH